MLICIIGNVASGKSTLAGALVKKLPGYALASLDDYRRKYKAHTLEREERAQASLIQKIRTTPNLVLECSGTGKWYSHYLVENPNHIQIQLHLPVPRCRERHLLRISEGYKLPPFCYDLDLDDVFRFMDQKLDGRGVDLKVQVYNKGLPDILAEVLQFLGPHIQRPKKRSLLQRFTSWA